MPDGTSVLAAREGTVIATESRHGASKDEEALTHDGNFVRVRHEDGTIATYAHLKHGGVAVGLGQRVQVGDLLGYSGATGDANGTQLHFGVSHFEGKGGALYEVSVPVRFYVGSPPLAFEPRRALLLTAKYSGEAEFPRTASERRMAYWKRPELPPDEMSKAWLTLVAFGLALVGGIVWYWRFARGG